jgi:cyclophilin family peptidyl-prolyl cis-trans isomerase
MLRALLWLTFAVTSGLTLHAGLAEGLYARFDTSMGSFTCRLEMERAPRTVANFVRLAEGSHDWLDFFRAEIRRGVPFYDGIRFHRVATNFVIQAGSPNGQGTDGPGYSFNDEFNPQLRHDRAGILSMANSGPNSNGSQFFITLTNTAFLNDRHSVFGSVSTGLDIVQAIGRVAVTNEVPLAPVTIRRIEIVRIGAAAQAFATNNAAQLPELSYQPARLQAATRTNALLTWSTNASSTYRVMGATALGTSNWLSTGESVWREANFTAQGVVGNSNFFFQVIEAQYFQPDF